MISLGFVNNMEFVSRYTSETERYVLPIAQEVNGYMLMELQSLVASRRRYAENYAKFKTEELYIDTSNFM